jgi:hypothetical protein
MFFNVSTLWPSPFVFRWPLRWHPVLKLNVKIGWNRIERENVFQKKKWKKERGRIQPEVTDITPAQKATEQYDQKLHPYMEVTPYTF